MDPSLVLEVVIRILLGCAVIVLVAVGVVVVGSHGLRELNRSTSRGARRIDLALLIGLLVAFGVSTVTSAGSASAQVFAQSGAERWIVGPVLYLCFAGTFLLTGDGRRRLQASLPTFLASPTALVVLLALATAAAGAMTLQAVPLLTAQGLALVAGFAVFLVAGLLSAPWDAPAARAFVVLVTAAGMITIYAGQGLGSFPALVVPAAGGLIAAALLARDRHRLLRVASFALGLGTIVLIIVRTSGSTDPSAGLQLQMALVLGIAALAVVPPRFRGAVAVLALLVIVAAIALSPLPSVAAGIGADDPDLTLAQRAYESNAVFEKLGSSPLTLIFGGGPGASVDLSASPDADTLAASGRTLTAVPSVHVLTSYILLKLGLLGILWFVVMIALIVRMSARVLQQPKVATFDVVLLMLVWAGLAAALPAATFFFSNPLTALPLGILMGRHARQGPPDIEPRRLELQRAAAGPVS